MNLSGIQGHGVKGHIGKVQMHAERFLRQASSLSHQSRGIGVKVKVLRLGIGNNTQFLEEFKKLHPSNLWNTKRYPEMHPVAHFATIVYTGGLMLNNIMCLHWIDERYDYQDLEGNFLFFDCFSRNTRYLCTKIDDVTKKTNMATNCFDHESEVEI